MLQNQIKDYFSSFKIDTDDIISLRSSMNVQAFITK